MAWLEPHRTSGHFNLCLRWQGKKLRRTLKTTEKKEAETTLHRFEENLRLLERGRLTLPDGGDLLTFLLSDGKLSGVPITPPVPAPAKLTLREISDRYLATLGNGTVEANSLATTRMHLQHFLRKLGDDFSIEGLKTPILQDYVNTRSRRKGKKKIPLSPATLRKEVASLRACWNWAVHSGFLAGAFPNKGLRFPKTNERPPFQTLDAIERIIARGGLSDTEQRALWDGLFLSVAEVAELLQHVKAHSAHAWIYPMVFTAAHTGMRRSELLRLRIEDVDFSSRTILVHEKKRVKGTCSTRRVPLSSHLDAVLHEWLEKHPGGVSLFAQTINTPHSKKGRVEATPITRDEAHDHFHRTLAGSKWKVLKGWHVLRHSFASNLAAKGIDQRMIDEFMGHQTDEQRRRYRHLFPHQQRQAICTVFDSGPPDPLAVAAAAAS
jgi:integrase